MFLFSLEIGTKDGISWLFFATQNTCKWTTNDSWKDKTKKKKKFQIIHSKHKVERQLIVLIFHVPVLKRFADKSQLPALKHFPYEI